MLMIWQTVCRTGALSILTSVIMKMPTSGSTQILPELTEKCLMQTLFWNNTKMHKKAGHFDVI